MGTTIPNIGVDKLKNIAIPLPSMEEQNRIAEKYQATLNEIVRLKNELASAVDKLHTIFDEECQEKTLWCKENLCDIPHKNQKYAILLVRTIIGGTIYVNAGIAKPDKREYTGKS